MSNVGIKWQNLQQFNSKLEVMKQAKKAEDASLKAGANLVKKSIKKEVLSSIPSANKRSKKYGDKLVDAVRSSKPYKDRAAISVYVWKTGNKSKGKSGKFRLQFFESSKDRYVKTYNGSPMKKKRYAGNLSRFNGFFNRGLANSQSSLQPTMQAALEKYIEKMW